jgi:phenylacetate-CoA ligase
MTANIECAPPEVLREAQNAGLQQMIERAMRVEFYRQPLTSYGLASATLTVDDLPRLPCTHKEDLRRHYPYGLWACRREDVVEIHASSGTTGKPTVVGYTAADLRTWKLAMARTLTAVGVTPDDVVQNAYGYGLFTGGLGFHYGCLALGAAVIPISGGRTDMQLTSAEDFGSTVLCCTPSFALHLASAAEAAGRSLQKTRLRLGVFGAEPWSEELRCLIESKSGLKAFDCYGLSEIIGPGVAFECEARAGLHINEDLFYPEVLDPQTGKPVPAGTVGELVLTSLAHEALPLLRYRTGDLTALRPGGCSCGRTLRKMDRIMGRTDDMLIVAGVNFYPSQVESLILDVPGANGQYQIWLSRDETRDRIEVRLEVEQDVFANANAVARVAERAAHLLHDNIGIRMTVSVVEPGSMERSQGKARRVFDQRGEKT